MKRVQLHVNDKTIECEVSKIDPGRNYHQYQALISTQLAKIGIGLKDHSIITENDAVRVRFRINDKWFENESTLQDSLTANMAAIALFIEQKVRNIRRGIEPISKAFGGYLLLTYGGIGGKEVDTYGLLEVPREATKDQVDRAFKAKATIYHPDSGINKDATKFQQIGEARESIYKERGWT